MSVEKKRVMVVDDDLAFLDMAVEILETEFEVIGAVNGLDALEKVERAEPELIVLDIAMPCVDGIDTCRALRKNVRFRDLPIIFISGQEENSYVNRLRGLGTTHFLRKPIAPADLLQSCHDVLREAGSQSAARRRYDVEELKSSFASTGETRAASLTAPTQAAESRSLAPAAGQPPPTAPGPDHALARILIVDDDPELVGFMLNALRGHFEVFGVNDPVSAIYKIIRYQPDLLIIENLMPRLSGYQLSQLLRLNPNLRTIKILFVSSKGSPQEIAYAQKLGATDYLLKPFKAEDLLQRVTRITEADDFIIREKALGFDDIRCAESADPAPSQFQ